VNSLSLPLVQKTPVRSVQLGKKQEKFPKLTEVEMWPKPMQVLRDGTGRLRTKQEATWTRIQQFGIIGACFERRADSPN
jgi:hypothetical protein